MTARILPPEEWHRLAGTELACLVGQTLPTVEVAVVEDHDGAIVGCWSLIQTYHTEGLWIAPEHRGHSGVGRRLLKLMQLLARSHNIAVVMTNAMSPEVTGLLEHVAATPVPGTMYAWQIGASRG